MENKKIKKESEGWVVLSTTHPNVIGGLHISFGSFDYTKKEAIAKFIEGTGQDWNWWARNYGFKCVKSKITIQAI